MADVATVAGDVTELVFVAVFVYTLVDFLRHRDRPHFDIALMFATLGLTISASFVHNALGADFAALSVVSSLAFAAHPYATLRLVEHFRTVPQGVRVFAMGGLVLAGGLIVGFPNGLSRPATLLFAAYIVIVDGYVASAFVRGAFTTRGVTRRRLQLAAGGTGLLALLLVLIGVIVAFPSAKATVGLLFVPVVVATGFAYFFAFVPPGPLRRTWQMAEVLHFLRETSGLPTAERAPRTVERFIAAASAVTAGGSAYVVLRGKDGTARVLRHEVAALIPPGALDRDVSVGLSVRAWRERAPVSGGRKEFGLLDVALADATGATVGLAVPISSVERSWGVLLVYLRVAPLFLADDIELLGLMAEQTALVLASAEFADELRAHAIELARSNADLEQFAYVASHDLREPLRMVTSYVELLRARYEGKLDKDADEFIRYAVDGAQRMQNLIGDLLAYSRVGAGTEKFGPVALGLVVDDAVEVLGESIRGARATVTRDPLPIVRGDATLLSQLFQNLIANAVKFHGSAPPLVHVSAERRDGAWVVGVRDNGIGIDPKYHDRIFIIFQRLDTRERYEGTGIGLAIVKKIVERHGGRIWVESKFGEGATFRFTLPAGEIGP